MNNTPELILKPNYLGLLVNTLIMGSAVYLLSRLILFFGAGIPHRSLEGDERLLLTILIPLLVIILVVCIASLLDILRTAMTGMRQNWRVRITREGIHHPLLSAQPIPWQNVDTTARTSGSPWHRLYGSRPYSTVLSAYSRASGSAT
jgi:hypothetical protein